MYAVIKTGGKQYKVSEGDLLKVEKIDGAVGDSIELNRITSYNVCYTKLLRAGSQMVERSSGLPNLPQKLQRYRRRRCW